MINNMWSVIITCEIKLIIIKHFNNFKVPLITCQVKSIIIEHSIIS